MAKSIGFNLKTTDKKVKKIQKALRDLSEDGFHDALENSLKDLQRQIGKQWGVSGGLLIDFKHPNKVAGILQGAPSYMMWKNAVETERVNVRPGVRTGYMRDQLQKPNSAAYKGSRVNKASISLKVLVEDQDTKRERTAINYADFFEQDMGLIPREAAVDSILKANIEFEMSLKLRKGGFKRKGK